MMIEKMSRDQVAAVYTAWLVLIDPRGEGRHENPAAFEAGRHWAIDQSFDAVLATTEFFVWNLATYAAASRRIWQDDDAFNYFGDAMATEIGEDEFNRIKSMGVEYRGAWVEGVADAFVLMGGNVIMSEWAPDRAAMH
jgi:hypothetical protein